MPIPVLVGIPLLISIITSAFTDLFTYFAKYFSKRLAIQLAIITAITAATAAFYGAAKTAAAGLKLVLPEYITASFQLVVPDNAEVCIAANLAVAVIRLAYVWKVQFISMRVS